MSNIMIPFNNQPVDTVQLNCSANSTASYTIPAGKYARVSYFVKYGAYITINGNYIAESFSTSDYAHPTASEPIQNGWEGFSSVLTCPASANGNNVVTYTFGTGYIYSNVRVSLELNNSSTAQLVRLTYGSDSNNFIRIYKENSTINASTKEYQLDPQAVYDNIHGSLRLELTASSVQAQTATLRIHGSVKREHDGQAFNNNGSIWLKSGDVIELGETHFSNSSAMCHIELYNEQS